jgi:hypothetical protein
VRAKSDGYFGASAMMVPNIVATIFSSAPFRAKQSAAQTMSVFSCAFHVSPCHETLAYSWSKQIHFEFDAEDIATLLAPRLERHNHKPNPKCS